VHPRPDARHIRADDVHDLPHLLKDWPEVEFNIEGNPFHNLMDFVRRHCARTSAPLCPTARSSSPATMAGPFPQDAARLKPLMAEARALGVRVSLFMDPDPSHGRRPGVGADRVELYTETYARAFGTPTRTRCWPSLPLRQAALDAGLGVNAGHDLSQENLTDFLRAVPGRAGGVHRPCADLRCAGIGLRAPRSKPTCTALRGLSTLHRTMIYGIGTDICDVRRIRASLDRHGERFARKILSDAELRDLAGSAAHDGPSGACATWPRASRPRRPSARR
jgi:hypothetical protein